MAKKLNIITNGLNGELPVQNQGLKLSKIISIEKIEEHEKFKALYSIDENLLQRITEDMKTNKFDASQPVHLWITAGDGGTEHFYLIDGYTRIKAAKLAGLSTVPYFEHHFESFDEAHRYALHLQIDRRNLEGADLLRNIELLMGSEYVKNLPGNKNAAIGEMLGVSEKTVERANFVKNNATEEQLAAIESKEATVNATFNDIKERQFLDKNATDEQKSKIENGEATEDEIFDEIKSSQKKKKSGRHVPIDDDFEGSDDDEPSDALEDTSGNPHGLNITDHTDGIERPSYAVHPEDDTDRWIKEKNIQVESAKKEGLEDGLKKGSDLAYEVYEYILSGIENGKTADVLRSDEKFADFSVWKIYKAFEIETENGEKE